MTGPSTQVAFVCVHQGTLAGCAAVSPYRKRRRKEHWERCRRCRPWPTCSCCSLCCSCGTPCRFYSCQWGMWTLHGPVAGYGLDAELTTRKGRHTGVLQPAHPLRSLTACGARERQRRGAAAASGGRGAFVAARGARPADSSILVRAGRAGGHCCKKWSGSVMVQLAQTTASALTPLHIAWQTACQGLDGWEEGFVHAAPADTPELPPRLAARVRGAHCRRC